MKTVVLVTALLVLAVPALAQDFALALLESSPRHHEWIAVPSRAGAVHCFVAWPEKKAKALAVVVIHENRGLDDWARSFADQLAEKGFIAIAPDLLSGFDSTRTRTADFASADEAREAIYKLDSEAVMQDLLAVRAHAETLEGANGRTAVAGFCWGGAQSFRLATVSNALAAALVFYGSPPADSTAYAGIHAPVYGFYGGDDERINASIPATIARMKSLGKTYDPVIYPGAGHAFMRRGDAPGERTPHHAARDAAWKRLAGILKKATR
jgi:carboxymethylenebutenolidase